MIFLRSINSLPLGQNEHNVEILGGAVEASTTRLTVPGNEEPAVRFQDH